MLCIIMLNVIILDPVSMSEIDFLNLITLSLILFHQKNPSQVKNEWYYQNGRVVNGNEHIISFILFICNHEW